MLRYDGSIPGLTGALTRLAAAEPRALATMSAAALAYAAGLSWPDIAQRTLAEITRRPRPGAGRPSPAAGQHAMTQLTAPASLRSRVRSRLRGITGDALYRGSLFLLINTVATSAIGFVFWALAARRYPAAAVGVFASVTSGVGLLAAIAALGLSNTIIRRVAGAVNPRELVAVAVAAIATVGTALCLLTVVLLGPLLPAALHLQQHGRMAFLVTVLVVCTAVSSTLDACLVGIRASHVVLVKNVLGSLAKVAALVLLTALRSSGLLIAYGLGLTLATVLSGVALSLRLRGRRVRLSSFRALPRYLSMTSGNYLATVMGIVPTSIVPVEVLIIRGAAETARFAVAFLIAGFLNFIPSTIAQVLFAEASRPGVTLGGQLRKAIRGVYGLVLPAVAMVVAAAPLLLRLFGRVVPAGHGLPAHPGAERAAHRGDIPGGLAAHRPRPHPGLCLHEWRQRRAGRRLCRGGAAPRADRRSRRLGGGPGPVPAARPGRAGHRADRPAPFAGQRRRPAAAGYSRSASAARSRL